VEKNLFILILISLSLITCKNSDIHNGKTPLVKVGDKYLYQEDLKSILPEDCTPEDSTIKVNSYIDIWIKKQLLVQKAETYLTDEQEDIDMKVEDYKNSLLIHKYKQKFIEQKLDTNITQEEIEECYLLHYEDFKLTKPAFKGVFVKILKSDDNYSNIKIWCISNNPKDSAKLEEYCIEKAAKYQDFEGDWVYLGNVLQEAPFEIENQEEFLTRREFIETEDETFYYYLKIKEYKLVNEVSPLVFCTDNIKTIILNKREKLMIEDLETTIFQNSLNDGNLEYLYK